MKKCAECGKDFVPSSRHKKCPACRERLYKTIFNKKCSCGKLIQQGSISCVTCTNHEKKVENYRYLTSGGYIYVRDQNHPRAVKSGGRVLEHILVMERRLGRYLLPHESVHHKNGIKTDNRDKNLELWTRNQPIGTRVGDLINHAKEILEQYGFDAERYL